MATQNTFKISQLSNIKDLDPSDLFLVSDHTNNTFYTRKLSAGVLFEKIQNKVITYLSSNEYMQMLATKIANIIAPTISSDITYPVIQKAVPQVSSEALPIVSSEALPILTAEVISLISDDITTLAIQDIISSDELSNAITISSTAIGYGVHQVANTAVSENLDDNVISNIISNTFTQTCIISAISANSQEIWDILDGSNDGIHTINAGDADPSDDIYGGDA